MIHHVTVSEKAYRQMFQHVLDYANPERPYRLWREVIGWLVGIVRDDTIDVLEAIPMTSGTSIFVEINDYSVIPKIAEQAEKINAVIVGWFHSHPSFGFFLSGVDIRTQRYQQRLFDNAIALVCDPTKIAENEPGIHGYQVNMTAHQKRAQYRELDLKVKTSKEYPVILEELLFDMNITTPFSKRIAPDQLSELYALEGISPFPGSGAITAKSYLLSERNAIAELEVDYYLPIKPQKLNDEIFIQVRINNKGKGIAWNVDLTFDPSPDFELLSYYPRRIIDQLSYESMIIETFKVKTKKIGDLVIPSIRIEYMESSQESKVVTVPQKTINLTANEKEK
jgi:proteasome lid subunit RPN8/RPN11